MVVDLILVNKLSYLLKKLDKSEDKKKIFKNLKTNLSNAKKSFKTQKETLQDLSSTEKNITKENLNVLPQEEIK